MIPPMVHKTMRRVGTVEAGLVYVGCPSFGCRSESLRSPGLEDKKNSGGESEVRDATIVLTVMQ